MVVEVPEQWRTVEGRCGPQRFSVRYETPPEALRTGRRPILACARLLADAWPGPGVWVTEPGNVETMGVESVDELSVDGVAVRVQRFDDSRALVTAAVTRLRASGLRPGMLEVGVDSGVPLSWSPRPVAGSIVRAGARVDLRQLPAG